MIVCKGKHNIYYPGPGQGLGLLCGSRRIRYYRGSLLITPKQPASLRLSQVREQIEAGV